MVASDGIAVAGNRDCGGGRCASKAGVIGGCSAAQGCRVTVNQVLNSVVVGVGGIGIGNGDGLIVFGGVGECVLDRCR